MEIWCIDSIKRTSLLLCRIERDKFRVVQYDDRTPLLINSDYILLDKKFKEIVAGLMGQVEIQDVTIYDNRRNITWDNYFELKILNNITPGSIHQVDGKGLKIWNYGNISVFVSENLKNEIQKIETEEFEFSKGFSYFAGS